MKVSGIKAFVPSKDYETSKAFYAEIGFSTEYVSDDLTLCENGECALFLQRFYQQDWAENFMLQVCVKDIEEAHELCLKSEHKEKISPISDERWGRIFFLWGPSGELLHVTQLAQ